MTSDQLQIVAVAAICAVGVGVVGLAAAWLLRHLSIRWQLGLIVVVAIGSVLLGIVAAARLMFISTHDWSVIALVALVAGVVSLVVAFAVGMAISRWSEALREDARLLDTHGSYVAVNRGPSELQALSEELARTSERLEESRLREARLEESRRELISWVSHDLRTPLAGMLAMTEASRTVSLPTRSATTARSGPRWTGWCGWSTTSSSFPGSTRASSGSPRSR